MEYEGDGWLGYDRRFRQTAAATPDITWAKIEPTLWNKAFAGQASSSRCKYCFSLTHRSEECDWAPTPVASHSFKQKSAGFEGRPRPPHRTNYNGRSSALYRSKHARDRSFCLVV